MHSPPCSLPYKILRFCLMWHDTKDLKSTLIKTNKIHSSSWAWWCKIVKQLEIDVKCPMQQTDKEENPIQYQLPLQLGMVMWHNLANEIREVCQRLLGKSHLPLLQAPSVPQCYFPLLPARNMDSQSCGRETLSWSWRWKSLTKKDKKGKSGTLRLSWTNSPALGCILQTPCYVLRRRKAPSLLKLLK